MSDSDSDEETPIRYGTPLEPYEEDAIPSKRKYQEPADQYALDAHGRRRFHGAFTGGFQAGHGNTVGTPEGWTPSSFKSSRTEKAQVSGQRPEDYMDEEDRSEHGIAPRLLTTNTEFTGQKRPRPAQYHDGPIPGEPVLEQVIRVVHETAAVKMLKAMGWKPGQGTGERVTKQEKRNAKDNHKVYGCYVPSELRQNQSTEETQSTDSDSDLDIDTLFAPDDYEPYMLARKSDRFGLGYSGLSRHSVLGGVRGEVSHLKMKDKGKRVSIRGQAFGVGAFEAEDEDIYANEDMSRYDFTLGSALVEPKDKKTKAKAIARVLPGFVASTKPMPTPPQHPPPALPRDYTPSPATKRSRFDACDAPQRDQGLGRHELTPEARGALLGETPIQPIQTSIQPPIQTPIQNEDPIAKILGRNVNFVSTKSNEVPILVEDEAKNENELNFIPIADSGKEVVKVFKPFMGNPKKQARYERYLKDRSAYMQAEDSNTDRLAQWERDRELIEFEQAAKLYRPLTGEMGDRFTHASQPDDVNPLTAVARSSTNYGLATPEQIQAAATGVYGVITRTVNQWRPDSLICKRFNVPQPHAAREDQKKEEKPKVSYSIFSYLESSVHDKESFAKEQSQFSGSKSISTEKSQQSHRISDFRTGNTEIRKGGSISTGISKKFSNEPSTSTKEFEFRNKRMTTAELFLRESEKDFKNSENIENKEVTDTIEKFDKMDLFKSIFLSDSEDEHIEEPSNVIDFDAILDIPKNTQRNTSPPKGIFANIDFDELNSWKRNTKDKKAENQENASNLENEERNSSDKKAENPVEKNSNITKEKDGNMSNTAEETSQPILDAYGPKIPENLQKRLENTVERDTFRPVFISRTEKEKEPDIVEINSSSSSDSWVDAEDVKSKSKKKVKKHKSKSKKHKVKSKHKKSKHKKKDR